MALLDPAVHTRDGDPTTAPAMLVDGRTMRPAASHDVVNPSTGQVIAAAPVASPADVGEAVAAARRALPGWAVDEARRRQVLHRIAEVVERHAGELARLVAGETGKPLPTAEIEPAWAADHARWLADVDIPTTVLADEPTRHVVLGHAPLGVVAAIVPWNVPLVMAVHKAAAAMRAGNTVVVKPSPYTPLATLRLGELLAEVVPPGVVNILSGGDDLGRGLTEHPDVNMISFTGSVDTGRLIMASAAPTLKRLCLELGGNDAAIILDDAHLDPIAPAVYNAAFLLSGQVCQAIKRLYVPRTHYEEVVDRLVALAEAARPGDPFDPRTTMGPLTTTAQLRRVEELVADARERGGTINTGGAALDRPGNFYPPTIVTDLPEDARLVREEQFGPVLPVLAYDSVDEAVERANATEFGLGASVWSSDVERARAVAGRLVAGSVWVNRHTGVEPDVPFGGMRQSGLGRESGLEGLLGYTDIRTLTLKCD